MAAVLLAVVGSLVATAAAGWSHADLVASEPGASETVTDPPDEVLLEFSEPLIEDVSHATVTDPDGQRFTDVAIDADWTLWIGFADDELTVLCARGPTHLDWSSADAQPPA